MESAVFWTAAGAVSTTVAVIVALWQTHYSNRKKLRVSFCENLTFLPTGQKRKITKNTYVSIEVINIGNRKVYIKEFGVKCGKQKGVIIPDVTPNGTIELPQELNVEQSLCFSLSKEHFYEILRDTTLFPANKRICFYAMDSCGDMHKCKTRKTPKVYLEEAKKGDTYNDQP